MRFIRVPLGIAVVVLSSAVAAKKYTRAQLRRMVSSGHPPALGAPTSNSKDLDFASCKAFTKQFIDAAAGNDYPTKIGSVGTTYSTKMWTNTGSVVLTCTEPGLLITTTSPYR